jgi:hypothetical protein
MMFAPCFIASAHDEAAKVSYQSALWVVVPLAVLHGGESDAARQRPSAAMPDEEPTWEDAEWL